MPLPRFTLILVATCIAASGAQATQLVLNPSFENHTASASTYNMINTVATSTIDNLTSFGDAATSHLGEMDLNKSVDTFFGSANDGDWFVHIHTNTSESGYSDAFSLELSSPLNIGQLYDLVFFANSGRSNLPNLEVGVSETASDFGVQVFSTSSYFSGNTEWTELSTSFNAPVAASYLTFRSGFLMDSGASLDNISLNAVPEPSTALLLGLVLSGLGFCRRSSRVG